MSDFRDIGRAQDDLVRLAERGGFKGSVLEIACGSGDNCLHLAAREGLEVLGIDPDPANVEKAQARAAAAGSKAAFQAGDPFGLGKLKKKFDTVLDSGFFHSLTDEQRPKYAKSLEKAIKNKGLLHILCFSDAEPAVPSGTRGVGERELIELLNMKGWLVEEVAEARFETSAHPDGARAWLATFQRWAPS
ncbi:MAG: class I SAM-dependent methyltransferase [Gemmataceae bacterium]|nr:class I SAM-dependent methyltransferase [Gemmataceae bacterium]